MTDFQPGAGHPPAASPAAETTEWRIGRNVPWSVAWTGEQQFELVLSNLFPGCVDLVQIEDPGNGLPRFAAQHVLRQRLGIARHHCHVCGRPTPRGDRFIFPAQSGGFVTLSDESVRYAGNVPPVHRACAKRAMELCPHLSTAFAQPVAYPSEASRVMPRLDVVEGMEALAKEMPSHLPVVYSCYRLYGPRFSLLAQRLRERPAGD